MAKVQSDYKRISSMSTCTCKSLHCWMSEIWSLRQATYSCIAYGAKSEFDRQRQSSFIENAVKVQMTCKLFASPKFQKAQMLCFAPPNFSIGILFCVYPTKGNENVSKFEFWRSEALVQQVIFPDKFRQHSKWNCLRQSIDATISAEPKNSLSVLSAFHLLM